MAIGVRKVQELSPEVFRGQGNEEKLAKITEKGTGSEEGKTKPYPEIEAEMCWKLSEEGISRMRECLVH